MKPLVLDLVQSIPSGLRMNLQGVTPTQLKDLPVERILSQKIGLGDQTSCLGDWFQATDGDRDVLRINGDLSRADYLGHEHSSGTIELNGSAGHHLADGMTGGKIIVHGSAGDCAGSGLRGGTVMIYGNSGDYTAGALPGKKRGMRGGQLVVTGNVGSWAAARMRRGLLIVQGQIGGGLAMRMIAGTVIACGAIQQPLGCGMRRGTIVLLDNSPANSLSQPPLPRSAVDRSGTGSQFDPSAASIPGFTRPEQAELLFLPLLLKQVRDYLPVRLQHKLPVAYADYPRTGWRSLGDLCTDGLGEVIWLRLE